MAGYKGYGYATVVEIFCAALQNGSWMKALNGIDENKKPVPYRLGHFFIAIDPEFFIGIETFKMIAGNICRELRASKKPPVTTEYIQQGKKNGKQKSSEKNTDAQFRKTCKR